MPYIPKDDREEVMERGPETAGELNFLVTKICLLYLGEKPNYQRYNDVVGALEGAKLEMYRRKVAPYEDVKIEENGDVEVTKEVGERADGKA